MHNRYRQLRRISLGCLLMIFIIGSGLIFQRELSAQEALVQRHVQERAHRLKEHLLLARAYVDSASRLIEARLSQSASSSALPASLQVSLANDSEYVFQATENARLTGLGVLAEQRQKPSWQRQVQALAWLDGLFEGAVENVADLNWFYFISAERFIYLSPKFPSDFHFTDDLYQGLHWQGVAALRPKDRLFVSGRYMDTAGKGEIITLAVPVRDQAGGNLLGVVGLDLRLANLVVDISFGETLGDSLLIDSAGNQIVRSKPAVQDDVKTLLEDSRLPLSQSIIPRQLTLVHYASSHQYIWAAIQASVVKWLLLFVALALVHAVIVLRLLVSRIEVLANTDPLTSLLNRRAMEQHLKMLININQRYQQRLCLLILDIDHFKKINDSYGHDVGDQVLVHLSRLLAETLRQSDLLSRHGGEEFLVALPNTSLSLAVDLAERIRIEVARQCIGKQAIGLTISIGCVELADTEDYNHAITRADQLLYRAKETGRNRVCAQSEQSHQ